ncbi:MAG: CBS domain-containing protein [Xanthomonadales bacterium]|nr:CBS domain-containing protein [Xanthomonadales bacterium]
MSTEVITAPPTATLAEARTLMQEHRIRHLPILNEDGELIGLLTQSDVLAASDSFLRDEANRIAAREITVANVMVTKIVTVSEQASLRRAALFLEQHRIGCLPVISDNRLVGIITDTDFVGVAINLLEQLEEFEPDGEIFGAEDDDIGAETLDR